MRLGVGMPRRQQNCGKQQLVLVATSRLTKHQIFVRCDSSICPDSQLIVIAREDDTTFSILHSLFYELCSLRLGVSLEDRSRYTPTARSQAFPFPEGLTPHIPADDYTEHSRAMVIAKAARRLVELSDRWLNPPECVEWVDEPILGYPTGTVTTAAAPLKNIGRRNLTNMLNERPRGFLDALSIGRNRRRYVFSVS